MSIGEQILIRLSRKPGTAEHGGATLNYTVENALDFPIKMIPDFLDRIRGKEILDFGCGPGYQAVAMLKRGAKAVVGIDINETWLEMATSLAQKHGVSERVAFYDARSFLRDKSNSGRLDITFSCGSFEHFGDPAAELRNMKLLTRPAGQIFICFAEPWLSPHGSHMYSFCKVPYVNVLFSEKTVMSVRSRFRDDGATRYEEIRSGLNKMTLRRFEAIIRESGMHIEYLHYAPVRGLPLVNKVPYLREFLVSGVTCLLSDRAAVEARGSQSRLRDPNAVDLPQVRSAVASESK